MRRPLSSQPTLGAALIAAAAFGLPEAGPMMKTAIRGGRRLDRKRCSCCGKKPWDCRKQAR
jgi:hypothetical protein